MSYFFRSGLNGLFKRIGKFYYLEKFKIFLWKLFKFVMKGYVFYILKKFLFVMYLVKCNIYWVFLLILLICWNFNNVCRN